MNVFSFCYICPIPCPPSSFLYVSFYFSSFHFNSSLFFVMFGAVLCCVMFFGVVFCFALICLPSLPMLLVCRVLPTPINDYLMHNNLMHETCLYFHNNDRVADIENI